MRTWTDSGSSVKIRGLMRTKKFQDPHISAVDERRNDDFFQILLHCFLEAAAAAAATR